MKWLELGTYSILKDNKLEIVLYEGYEKALVKLEQFSHCLLFLLMKDSVDIKVVKIDEVNDKRGLLVVEGIHSHGVIVEGQLL